jgi:hypothetical protein
VVNGEVVGGNDVESIYRFYVDCGRHGALNGTFAATPEDVAFACGKTVYFSEPWGKHSGVEVTFEADMFTVVSSEPAEVATFNRLDLRSGECPLGLLHDAIMDRSMVLADEERDNAPPYFKSALGVVSGASSDP